MGDRFAAIHSAAGSLSIAPAPSTSPVPYIATAGEVDDRFLERVGLEALPLRESLLTEVPEYKTGKIDPMLTTLQLEDAYAYDEQLVAQRKVIRFTYAKSKVEAKNTFQAIVIEGLGHQYPNGKNHPIVLADHLWEMFRAHSR
jgi:poly(3-hydroxybutyrate) depolymerase